MTLGRCVLLSLFGYWIPRGTLGIVIQEVLWSAIWSIPLTNLKWHSDPWPVTSEPIRLSTNFVTLIPSLTFTELRVVLWSICNGCGMPAGYACPSGHLVPSRFYELAYAPIVETRFPEFSVSLLDVSIDSIPPWIPRYFLDLISRTLNEDV